MVADVPGVGQNHQDHHAVNLLNYKYKHYKESTLNSFRLITALPSYKTTPTGMYYSSEFSVKYVSRGFTIIFN